MVLMTATGMGPGENPERSATDSFDTAQARLVNAAKAEIRLFEVQGAATRLEEKRLRHDAADAWQELADIAIRRSSQLLLPPPAPPPSSSNDASACV